MPQFSSKPYSVFTIITKYAKYWLSSGNRHSVHSPLIFDFIENVLNTAKSIDIKEIEDARKVLKRNNNYFDFTDYGRGGTKTSKRIGDIAKGSLKPKKYAKVIAQTANYFQAKTVLELGTSLGITSSYIANNQSLHLTTLEGDKNVAGLAQAGWDKLGYNNITSLVGDFDTTLPSLENKVFDIIFIDGNHHLEPTLKYYNDLLKNTHQNTMFIFDDIHYSPEMEEAWRQIKASPNAKATVDLFFLGYVFITPTLSKQDFIIRY